MLEPRFELAGERRQKRRRFPQQPFTFKSTRVETQFLAAIRIPPIFGDLLKYFLHYDPH